MNNRKNTSSTARRIRHVGASHRPPVSPPEVRGAPWQSRHIKLEIDTAPASPGVALSDIVAGLNAASGATLTYEIKIKSVTVYQFATIGRLRTTVDVIVNSLDSSNLLAPVECARLQHTGSTTEPARVGWTFSDIEQGKCLSVAQGDLRVLNIASNGQDSSAEVHVFLNVRPTG